jgi:ABC-type uncharacterized transport system substrate-binding protein
MNCERTGRVSLKFVAMLMCGWLWVSDGSAQAPAAVVDYHPSMGDLMTSAIQPRHTKLGQAGFNGNWVYAEYELSELRNAFARIARTIPTYRNADMTVLMGAMTTPSLQTVEDSIRSKDVPRFKTAYTQLTAACNACHVSQEHAMVVIRVPSGDAYPDQDFSNPRHQ